jgi:hypothetical protein
MAHWRRPECRSSHGSLRGYSGQSEKGSYRSKNEAPDIPSCAGVAVLHWTAIARLLGVIAENASAAGRNPICRARCGRWKATAWSGWNAANAGRIMPKVTHDRWNWACRCSGVRRRARRVPGQAESDKLFGRLGAWRGVRFDQLLLPIRALPGRNPLALTRSRRPSPGLARNESVAGPGATKPWAGRDAPSRARRWKVRGFSGY